MKDLNELKKIIDNLGFDGIQRKLDELGRVVIPVEYRNGMYEVGDAVYLQVIDDYLVLTKNNNFKIGILKKFDELGRVQITKDMRDKLNWEYRDSLMVWSFNGDLILKKVEDKCIFCKNENQLTSFKNRFICFDCKKEFLEENKDV